MCVTFGWRTFVFVIYIKFNGVVRGPIFITGMVKADSGSENGAAQQDDLKVDCAEGGAGLAHGIIKRLIPPE